MLARLSWAPVHIQVCPSRMSTVSTRVQRNGEHQSQELVYLTCVLGLVLRAQMMEFSVEESLHVESWPVKEMLRYNISPWYVDTLQKTSGSIIFRFAENTHRDIAAPITTG